MRPDGNDLRTRKSAVKRQLVGILAAAGLAALGYFVSFSDSETKAKAAAAPEKSAVELSTKQQPKADLGNIPVYFEENQGQFDERVRFLARGTHGLDLFVTATDAVYVVHEPMQEGSRPSPADMRSPDQNTPKPPHMATAVYMRLEGAAANTTSRGSDALAHRTNYFKGTEENWRTNIPNYQGLRTDGVYPGIDMVWHGRENGGVQYDFIVAPNADPSQIEWKVDGAKQIELTDEGDLLIHTEYGDIRQQRPYTYQDSGSGVRSDVDSRFVIDGSDRVRFDVGEYDRSRPLTIDPSVNLSNLSFSTFLGGSSNDTGLAVGVDGAGNVYVTGYTASPLFPTTPGTFDTSQNGSNDVFVTKLNAAGTGLIYSTFLGGSSDDGGYGIAVDASGNVYMTGITINGATDYPTTVGAYDTTHNGSNDVFVTKLNASGTALIYSTFIGGRGVDYGFGIAVDSSGSAYVTGYTYDDTTDYPTTAGAYDTAHNGLFDVFATKLNTTGGALVYSTFIGGSSNDIGNGIAVDPSGNTYVTGYANDGATDYPTTPDAFQTQHNGISDAFVTKLGDFSISGRTVNTVGDPLVSMAIGLSGDGDGFVLTDQEGYFAFTDTLANGTYLTAALHDGFNFNPSNYEINTLNRNKRVTFIGRLVGAGPTVAYADLGGGVTSTAGNIGLPFTTLRLIDVYGGVRTTTTDANGGYVFDNVRTGASYVVVAEREGYDFSPGAAHINFMDENLALNFSARPNSPRPVRDFDGDGKTDLAVFRPSSGVWYILESQTNSVRAVQFGVDGDIPLAEDYDGDGRTDLAVYRPSNSVWYRLNSSDGSFTAMSFGSAGDIPVPADYDGDRHTDIAVYRPSTGTWHMLGSANGYSAIQWGIAADRPVPADFDSDGRADLTVYRDGTWYRLNSSNYSMSVSQFGTADDRPLAADLDGDGRADTAVFRPATGVWYWLDTIDSEFHAMQFGVSTDTPVPADYNGDGRMEQAVFRSGTWYIPQPDGSLSVGQFGINADLPVNSIR